MRRCWVSLFAGTIDGTKNANCPAVVDILPYLLPFTGAGLRHYVVCVPVVVGALVCVRLSRVLRWMQTPPVRTIDPRGALWVVYALIT